MTGPLPTLDTAKDLAKRLRARLKREGLAMGHGQALERIAHQHGFRDWNALRAAIGDMPPADWMVGDRVRGRYLSRPFEAEITSVEPLRPGWFRLTLDLAGPVDVVRFETFSNFRSRVQSVIGPAGHSREKTSDGEPQLVLQAAGRAGANGNCRRKPDPRARRDRLRFP